jgi:hypothetical protein
MTCKTRATATAVAGMSTTTRSITRLEFHDHARNQSSSMKEVSFFLYCTVLYITVGCAIGTLNMHSWRRNGRLVVYYEHQRTTDYFIDNMNTTTFCTVVLVSMVVVGGKQKKIVCGCLLEEICPPAREGDQSNKLWDGEIVVYCTLVGICP